MKGTNYYIKYLLLLVILFNISACNIAAGSYPYAEEYIVNTDEDHLIIAVNDFKKKHPEYDVPSQTQLTDGRDNERDLWYHIYLYFPEEDQIIHTWIQTGFDGKTKFAFEAVNQGLTLGNWKRINKDFDSSDNDDEKEKFEKRILNVIKSKI